MYPPKIPLKDDLPLAVHIDDTAEGDNIPCHTPATTPIHWCDIAEALFQQYHDLGILEKVGLDIKTKWCHGGFWTRKGDGVFWWISRI